MKNILSAIFENPILLSIVTGIITFLITWPLNNWLTKRTSKKEHRKRIDKTNSAIIKTCEDYVIMTREKDENIFEKIIRGICVENKVNVDDVYSVQSVTAILIKNFVNMRLISDDDKKSVIKELTVVPTKPHVPEKEFEKIVYIDTIGREQSFVTTLSTITISLSLVMAMLLVLLEIKSEKPYGTIGTNSDVIIFIVMYCMIMFAMILVLPNLARHFKRLLWEMRKTREDKSTRKMNDKNIKDIH